MDLLNMIGGGAQQIGGSAMDLLRTLAMGSPQGAAPSPGNPAEQIPGANQDYARQQAQLNYANNMHAATVAGMPWYAAGNAAQAKTNDQYTNDLQDSAKILDVARQSREAAAARARYPDILAQSAQELGLTPAQKAALEVMPADQGIAELGKIATLKSQNAAQRYSMTAMGDGTALVLDKATGTTQMVTGNGQTVKVDHVPVGDGTFMLIDKQGNYKGHIDANGQPVTTTGTDPVAVQFAAKVYATTGKFPEGMSRNKAFMSAVMSEAARTIDPAGVGATQADFKATSSALAKNSQQETATRSFEQTAQQNLQLALGEAKKLGLGGSPLFNKGLLAWRSGVVNDPQTAAFVNALNTFKAEYAKVMSGSLGNQASTDAANAKADKLFSDVNSYDTLLRVSQIAQKEMGNRISSITGERQRLIGHLQGADKKPDEPTPHTDPLGLR